MDFRRCPYDCFYFPRVVTSLAGLNANDDGVMLQFIPDSFAIYAVGTLRISDDIKPRTVPIKCPCNLVHGMKGRETVDLAR